VGGFARFFIGAALGLLLGLWFGVNLGRGRPVYANPFHEFSLGENLQYHTDNVFERRGEAVEQSLEALRRHRQLGQSR